MSSIKILGAALIFTLTDFVFFQTTSSAKENKNTIELYQPTNINRHFEEITIIVDSPIWRDISLEAVKNIKHKTQNLILEIDDICDKNCSAIIWPLSDQIILKDNAFIILNTSPVYTDLQIMSTNLMIEGKLDFRRLKIAANAKKNGYSTVKEILNNADTPPLTPHFLVHHSFALAHLEKVHGHCIDPTKLHVLVDRKDIHIPKNKDELSYDEQDIKTLITMMISNGHSSFSLVEGYSFKSLAQIRDGVPTNRESFIRCN